MKNQPIAEARPLTPAQPIQTAPRRCPRCKSRTHATTNLVWCDACWYTRWLV